MRGKLQVGVWNEIPMDSAKIAPNAGRDRCGGCGTYGSDRADSDGSSDGLETSLDRIYTSMIQGMLREVRRRSYRRVAVPAVLVSHGGPGPLITSSRQRAGPRFRQSIEWPM